MLNQHTLFPALILSTAILSACNDGGSGSAVNLDPGPNFNMDIPESMTGSVAPVAQPKSSSLQPVASKITNMVSGVTAQKGTSEPCSYMGIEDEDPFRNGYQTTKFLVSVMATWTCIADLLIDLSEVVPHNGEIIETDNDTNADNYDADEPTHYSVSDDSATQTTVRLYYGYNRSTPPVVGETPQFFISWNEDDNDEIQGRLVIDGTGVNWEHQDNDDPIMMRMDFDYTATNKQADMFLKFDTNNTWADGFRIQIDKDLTANAFEKVYEAKGLMKMKAQYTPLDNITEIPYLKLFTVANQLGEGAAIMELEDFGVPLELNVNTGNHLGNYLFTKNDRYFFEGDGDWDYIYKTVASSEFRGNRTTPATGGTWIPFDPSLDLIVAGLSLDPAYFTGSLCVSLGDDCNEFLNAVFNDGFAEQEPNQGTDPLDWRSTELLTPTYLSSVYPNGIDWTDAFEFSFTPGI